MRIANIVKGLRTFARSDENQIMNFGAFDVIQESFDMLKDIYQKEGVALGFSGNKQDALIYGNRGRFQQVLVNLITNAKDATEGLSDRKIELKVNYQNEEIVVEVKDNGSGIPENIQDKIF